MIGIKTADRSFYPIINEDFRGRKKLVLTTVRDNQSQVQIDLYRGEGKSTDNTEYIGSLVIENIKPAPKGEPEIEVHIGIDDTGTLNTTAHDSVTGEKQTLSVSLESLSQEKIGDLPNFEMGEELEQEILRDAVPEEEGVVETEIEDIPEESSLTGETYPIGTVDRRKEHIERKRKSPLLLLLFIIIGLVIIAVSAYFIYKNLHGETVPPLNAGKVETLQPKGAEQSGEIDNKGVQKTAESTSKTVQGKTVQKSNSSQSAQKTTTALTVEDVWYTIKKGDTLWDISSTYYRNPWLYPKIARANRIKNPDLIFAGTKIVIPSN
ncbi:MAG: peptidoglycan-binding protein [Spirochaetes bacterium]|nr:MAG: peptidoglycan-binding protein [Spirochaetota bacterium]